jgi:Terminase RNaseH-like domain
MKPFKKSLGKEIVKRLNKANEKKLFRLEDYLFPEQLAFVNDPSLNAIAVCSRRAGKSTAVAADLVMTADRTPECTSLYVTGTRSDAKKIIWREILKFNRIHALGGVPNISELTLSFENGSIVRLNGAKDENEIDKIRGQLPPIKKVFIDEAQKIRDSILVQLIDDVLEPALLDYGASIALLGTPGSIPSGYFYRMAHNLKEDGTLLDSKVWSTHAWTFFNNPFMAIKSKTSHMDLLNRVLKRRGLSIDHPSIQREYFGKWTLDLESLLVHYDAAKNDFDVIPTLKKPYSYIMGIDLGFDDADSISILAWHDDSPVTYLVEEKVTSGQGITELVEQVQVFQRKYDLSKIVIDQGGLGKKVAEELRRRHQIPCVAADKARKMEHVAFLNDALRTGRFKAKRDSRFAQDSYMVEIDRDKSTPDKIKVSEKFHSDALDSTLYAFVESPAYSYSPPLVKPHIHTREWYLAQEDEMFQTAVEQMKREAEITKDPWEQILKGEI